MSRGLSRLVNVVCGGVAIYVRFAVGVQVGLGVRYVYFKDLGLLRTVSDSNRITLCIRLGYGCAWGL